MLIHSRKLPVWFGWTMKRSSQLAKIVTQKYGKSSQFEQFEEKKKTKQKSAISISYSLNCNHITYNNRKKNTQNQQQQISCKLFFIKETLSNKPFCNLFMAFL